MAQIRFMKYEDIKQVVKLEKEIFSVPWSKAVLVEACADPKYIFLVVEENTEIIGYGGLYIVLDEGNITNIAVDERFRKQHVGSKLIDCLIKAAARRGVRDITLEVRVSNQAAIRLYENAGFKGEGIRRDYYDKPDEDALVMWKRNINYHF